MNRISRSATLLTTCASSRFESRPRPEYEEAAAYMKEALLQFEAARDPSRLKIAIAVMVLLFRFDQLLVNLLGHGRG